MTNKFLGYIFLLSFFVISPSISEASEVFSEATGKATEVFTGLRTLAYVLSGFGIAAVATSAIFGKMNLRWLTMIVVGLFILASAEKIAQYITGSAVEDSSQTPSGTGSSNDSSKPSCSTLPPDDRADGRANGYCD